MKLEFRLRQIKSAKVLILPSILNYGGNLSLKNKLETLAAEKHSRIGVDVSQLIYIGSLTIGLFAFANKLVIEHGGEFFLLAPNENILRILAKIHTIKSLKIYHSESEIPD